MEKAKENKLAVRPAQILSTTETGIEVEGGVVPPAAIQTIVLLQISQRLRRVYESVEDQTAEGIVEQHTLAATDQVQELRLPFPWMSFSLINNGLGALYISTNEYDETETAVESGELINLDAKGHAIRKVYYWCPLGQTATFRIFGLR